MTFYYRFKDYSHTREEGPIIQCETYVLMKTTAKGVWIGQTWDIEGKYWKFINTTKQKQFAHDNLEDAAYSYQRRKEKQEAILQNQLRRVQRSLDRIRDVDESYKTYLSNYRIISEAYSNLPKETSNANS